MSLGSHAKRQWNGVVGLAGAVVLLGVGVEEARIECTILGKANGAEMIANTRENQDD